MPIKIYFFDDFYLIIWKVFFGIEVINIILVSLAILFVVDKVILLKVIFYS